MKKLSMVLLLGLTILLTGCATIMTGTSQRVAVNSSVSNAKVYVDGSLRGEAPIILDLATKKDYTIKIEAEGYAPYTEVLRNKASGWVWGNIFLGGIIGLGVDMITGGLYVLEKDTINGQFYQREVAHLDKK
ncbi:MAG: PEGA domain-containing protein [Fusobacteriaceae bacterium]